MDERRLESILRDGPPDEPAYRGDIAARLNDRRDPGKSGKANVTTLVPVADRASRRPSRWVVPASAAGVVAVLVAGLVLTLGGADETRVTTPEVRDPGVLVDRWVGAPGVDSTTGAFLDFRANGEFAYVTGVASVPTRWGSTWTVDDAGLLTLELNSEEQRCPAGAVGQYRWTGPPAATALTLSVVDDECAPRAADLGGTWTHTACPVGGSDCLGPVDAGSYVSVTFDPVGTNRYGQLGYDLPGGWAVTADSQALLSLRPADGNGAAGIDVWADVAVATPGCDGVPDVAASGASAITDALVDHEGLAASRSQASVDGREAQLVVAAVADGWSQVCPDEGDAPFVALLASRSGVPVAWATGVSTGEQIRLFLVDVADGRTAAVVVRGAVDGADSIVESFRFSDESRTP